MSAILILGIIMKTGWEQPHPPLLDASLPDLGSPEQPASPVLPVLLESQAQLSAEKQIPLRALGYGSKY